MGRSAAAEMIRQGVLWNSLIMVARVGCVLELVRHVRLLPMSPTPLDLAAPAGGAGLLA